MKKVQRDAEDGWRSVKSILNSDLGMLEQRSKQILIRRYETQSGEEGLKTLNKTEGTAPYGKIEWRNPIPKNISNPDSFELFSAETQVRSVNLFRKTNILRHDQSKFGDYFLKTLRRTKNHCGDILIRGLDIGMSNAVQFHARPGVYPKLFPITAGGKCGHPCGEIAVTTGRPKRRDFSRHPDGSTLVKIQNASAIFFCRHVKKNILKTAGHDAMAPASCATNK